MKKIISTILTILFLPSFVLAAPSVSGVSGTLTHGSDVTISGSGFGTKSTAAPALFDKVEGTWAGLSNGQAIPTATAPWTGDSESTYNTSSGEQRSIRSSANYHTVNSTYNFVDGFVAPGRSSKLYVAWWFRDNLFDTGGKFLRLSDSTNLENRTFTWANQGSYLYDYGDCIISGGSSVLWQSTQVPANIWHFHEIYFDTAAKTWAVYVDGVSHGSTRYSGCNSLIIDEVWKVGMDAGGESPPTQTSWLDDIYIDNTWTHVVIGNASTYTACTHFEVQPASAWGASSASIKINQGSFADGSSQYLYVVDSTGVANATGFPITLGSSGGGDTTAPASPSGLSVF